MQHSINQLAQISLAKVNIQLVNDPTGTEIALANLVLITFLGRGPVSLILMNGFGDGVGEMLIVNSGKAKDGPKLVRTNGMLVGEPKGTKEEIFYLSEKSGALRRKAG